MPGKAYTMKEMKTIVEYLTYHKVYSEIKGRKMWMDLESSKLTNRTWQSLKETFLKRILPDIHNPYYKLSVQQISSFQQGYDVETRLNNKLEIRTTDPEINKNGENTDTQIPDINNRKDGDKPAGEDLLPSTLRASTETLVLENCYETSEEICRDLQSPTELDDDKEKSPTKSMRELITYSEPLTPMLQSVIDDFASDEDCDEPKMQIVEQEEPADKNAGNIEDNVTIEISDSEGNETQVPEKSNHLSHGELSSPNKSNCTNNSPSKVKEINESEQPENLHSTKDKSIKDDITDKSINDVSLKTSKDDNLKSSYEINKNVSNNTTDTVLPGNQEALKNKFTALANNLKLSINKKKQIQNGRKRASSQDIEVKSKKIFLYKQKSISDTEPSLSISGNINKILDVSSVKQTITEESTQIPPNIVPSENKLDKETVSTADLNQDIVLTNSAENENPCLNSVSLYAEQFSNVKYTDSETSNIEDKNNGDKNEKTPKKMDMLDNESDENEKREQVNAKKERKHEKKHKKSGKTEENNTKNNSNNEKNNVKIGKNDTPVHTSVRNDDDMILLNSHSDSVSESANIPSKKGQKRIAKQQKERALANVFGFSSGGVTKSHRRSLECRKRKISHKHKNRISSASSDRTSDTGSDDMPPPRKCTRKSRVFRKYLRPKPARIMSLEEKGGLFVMYGKKIYPLVKNGKIVKNYLTYTPEDDPDSDESFWKLKYVEEKKKTAELTKLLHEVEEKKKIEQEEVNKEPILATTHNSHASAEQQDAPQPRTSTSAPAEINSEAKAFASKADTDMNSVKIKIIKKNEEVQIEGHWSHLNPVLTHVAQLFHKEPEEKKIRTLAIRESIKPKIILRKSAPVETRPNPVLETVEIIDPTTPVEDVIERVNQREEEIAKEIEKHFKAESSLEVDSNEGNITKRRGRPRSSPAIETAEPAKKVKLDTADHAKEANVNEAATTEQAMDTNENKVETAEQNVETTEHKVQSPQHGEKIPQISGTEPTEKVTEAEQTKNVKRRRTRTPKTVSAGEANDNYALRTRRSTSRKSSEQGVDNPKVTNSKVAQEEDNIRYKFPPTSATTKKSSTVTKKTNQRNTKSGKSLYVNTSCENAPVTSEENKDENQDSEVSGSSVYIKRRKMNVSPHKKKVQTRARQETHSYWTDDVTSESSNSLATVPLKSMTFQNSTLPSDVYTSESYQLLMNKECLPNTKTSKLGRIEEANITSDVDLNDDIFNKIRSSFINGNTDLKEHKNKLQIGTDNDNSSNISLPSSPVLSIVEDITISKVLLSSVESYDFSLNDKMESNANKQIMLNELMSPELDSSLPLMQQDYGLERSCQHGIKYHYNLNIPSTDVPVSDTLLKKINTINIDDPTLSESLTAKLRDLLLKSSKKSSNDIISDEKQQGGKPENKKIKSSKRSSTPRKRQSIRNLNLTDAKTCIEEEHMESCSQMSRKTCHPHILITDYDATDKEQNSQNETTKVINEIPKRRRKKKEIIKVKINSTKGKAQDASGSKLKKHESKFTDSGINESNFILKDLNESIDLIHNHSETCLSAHECMGDSVQIIEKSAISMVSLNSNSSHSDIMFSQKNEPNTSSALTQELFSSDAQDDSDLTKEPTQLNKDASTVYHTPHETLDSPNSLISDDLSDEIPYMAHQNTKWYLLSEEETNSDFINANNNSEVIGCGSRLDQIFPITCAIPDLSTITEMSRENGDTKKCDDSNTM